MTGLTVWAGSTGLDAPALRPGEDLVLGLAIGDTLRVPEGCAADDYLDPAARIAVDADADRRYADWRGDGHVVDGLDLSWVWEVEMKAQVFQPLARLAAALEAMGSPPVTLRGFAPVVADALAAELGARVEPSDVGVPPRIPRGREHPLVERAGRALRAVGLRPRVRGDIVGMHYWHLTALYARLPIVPTGPLVREQALRRTVGTAIRRGWTGTARPGPHAPLPGLLGELAGPSLAEFAHLRRAFARRAPKLAVVPWDSPDVARVLLAAAHEAGATSLVVQHGMENLLGDPDKRTARHVAVWSEHDARALGDRAAGELHVTGNPAAGHYVPGARVQGERIVLLVEYAARLSARVPARIPMRHAAAALEGLEQGRPSATVVIRPHPSDHERAEYERLAARHPRIQVTIDATTPIEPLLQSAALCVGALSTATLQSAALGVPTVFFDVTGAERPWPFEGTLPKATTPEELAGARPEVAQEVALEAIGARPDALDQVTALARRLAGS